MTPQVNSLLRSLPALPYEYRDALPDTSGVYLVMAKDEVLYVGATKSINKRFKAHENKHYFYKAGNPIIIWLECDAARRHQVEQGLIRCFNPFLNLHHKTNPIGNRYWNFQDWLSRFHSMRNGTKRKRAKKR